MKIKDELYQKIHNGIRAVVDYYGGPAKVKELATAKKFTNIRVMWEIWHILNDNLMYADTHPKFKKGFPRIVPHEPNFNIYSDNSINDNHIETALVKIGKEFGLI